MARAAHAQFLETFKRPAKVDRELLIQVARTALRTKVRAITPRPGWRHGARGLTVGAGGSSALGAQLPRESADHLTEAVVDAVLTIQRPGEKIDLFMVEIQKMIHKTESDTKVRPRVSFLGGLPPCRARC